MIWKLRKMNCEEWKEGNRSLEAGALTVVCDIPVGHCFFMTSSSSVVKDPTPTPSNLTFLKEDLLDRDGSNVVVGTSL